MHAGGSGATATQRRGKLVATNATTGRLPDNIIATAPNAAKLGGFTHTQLRSFPLSVTGALAQGGASLAADGGLVLDNSGTPSITLTFPLPPDYHVGGTVSLDLVLEDINSGGCSIALSTDGLSGPVAGAASLTNHWSVSGDSPSGTVSFPSQAGSVMVKKTITWRSASTSPGSMIRLQLVRSSADLNDTCSGGTEVWSALVRY